MQPEIHVAAVQMKSEPLAPDANREKLVHLAHEAGLAGAGFDVRAVRPPSVPPGTARLRVTVRYPVADADLRRFAAEAGVDLIETSHEVSENPGLARFAEILQKAFPEAPVVFHEKGVVKPDRNYTGSGPYTIAVAATRL